MKGLKLKAVVMPMLWMLFVAYPAICYAGGGIADAFEDHQHWIFPAYAYCLAFGLGILAVFVSISFAVRKCIWHTFLSLSVFLRTRGIAAILVAGVLWSVILCVVMSALGEIMWILVILLYLYLIVAFPIVLVKRRIRCKFLLSPRMLMAATYISSAAVIASVMFIILTNANLLDGTDRTYLARPGGWHNDFYHPTHPYDSMKEIWMPVILFLGETVITAALYGIVCLTRYVACKLSRRKARRRPDEC